MCLCSVLQRCTVDRLSLQALALPWKEKRNDKMCKRMIVIYTAAFPFHFRTGRLINPGNSETRRSCSETKMPADFPAIMLNWDICLSCLLAHGAPLQVWWNWRWQSRVPGRMEASKPPAWEMTHHRIVCCLFWFPITHCKTFYFIPTSHYKILECRLEGEKQNPIHLKSSKE